MKPGFFILTKNRGPKRLFAFIHVAPMEVAGKKARKRPLPAITKITKNFFAAAIFFKNYNNFV